ncbi:ATP-binding protein [Variovorax sp. PCZ-1]|uniref:sensor histidine kinase n=1 Tax=Variovorax sp. PCZ-1 TaxID=2835533 RepID=UPI001BCA6B04|nr:ATP-binding protein [Variovorax sp. PCZ-1]MBS7809116.1 HAMP domain-containing protein [Variovorax sp. PCZ-1]
MQIPFFHRLYVRIWLAVVLAVVVLAMLVGWLLRTQAERIRAERLAEVPAREVLMRNKAGEVIGKMTVQPVRVPGRGVEFHVQLPEGVKGGEQLAISLPPRQRPDGAGPPGSKDSRWWSIRNGAGERGAPPSLGFVALLAAFAFAVALGSYPVVRRLTQRLESLQRGVERLGAGDLRARVDETGQDEAAFLAKRFNRAADQVEALVQSQKSMLANASHELRSPLARIRMGLELMETAPSASLKAELSRNIAELDALIDEILLASRLETQASGALQAVREPVDLLALAAEEGARLNVELTWSGGIHNALLPGDARLLRRLIRNLLENAQRHGGHDVSLGVCADASEVQIEVADRGPGVPLDERERIFEPFYRSRHASEQHGGVGLGLSLVRSIARQHGGSVQCLGRDDGQGARFLVRIPKTAM